MTNLEQENLQLRRAVEELAFLNELSAAIGSSMDTEKIMRTIVKKSIKAVRAEQGSITLVNEEANSEQKTLVRTMVSSADHKPLGLSDGLLGWMHLYKKPLIMIDAQNDERFRGMNIDENIRSVLCVPLLIKSMLMGILSVFNKKDHSDFNDDDSRIMSIVASQSAQIIDNARLYEEEKALLAFREEARMATQIQKNLLPKNNPVVEGYDIAGVSVSALNVGGDYYDFIPVDDTSIAVCLGDISGKGMPAALLMSNLQAAIRGQIAEAQTPKQYVAKANSQLYNASEMNKFATFFFSILKPEEDEIFFTNAGHDPPMLLGADGSVRRLTSGGPVIGFMEGVAYLEEKVKLVAGDLLLVFTDGVTEAMNDREEEFGEERLQELLTASKDLSAEEIISTITDKVKEHSGDVPQSDDITMVVVKRV